MKKYILTAIAIFFLAIGSAQAMTVSFDLESDYTAGSDTVTYSLSLTTDSTISVRGLRYDFEYDETELTYVSYENYGQETFNMYYSEYSDGYPYTVNEEEGQISNYYTRVISRDYIKSIDAGTYLLATFTFSVADDATIDGASDFYMLLANYLKFYDADGASYDEDDATFNAMIYVSDIGTSAVPLPTTAWLLGSGIVGLVGLRRKNAA